MAASTAYSATYDVLQRMYTPDVTDWFLSHNTNFWTKQVKPAKALPLPSGDGWYWEMNLQSAQNIGTPGEGEAVPTQKAGTVVQGRVRPGQFVGSIELSMLLEAVGSGNGAWKSIAKKEMSACLADLTKHVNRLYAGTHGTGRIAQVDAATASSTSFVGKLPYGVRLLRPNMLVEIRDDDTGSGGTEDASALITKIVGSTRTVTLADEQTLDANDHVYIAGSYGKSTVPNGIAGLIDDGTNLVTVHNQSRDTYEELKSIVLGNGGSVRPFDEELLDQAQGDVFQASDKTVDVLLMNSGVRNAYMAFMRPDRRVNTSGGDAPNYTSGFGPKTFHVWGGERAELVVSQDVAPRTIYGLSMSTIRRLGDSNLKWLTWGDGVFNQGVTTTGYTTSKVGTLLFLSNIACLQPNGNFRIDDISDKHLCGPSVGGTDA